MSTFVLAEARVEAVLGEDAEIAGALLRRRARGALRLLPLGRSSPPATARRGRLPIVADEFVTTEDGTGIVHLAPAFGEDDYRVAASRRASRSTRRARRPC